MTRGFVALVGAGPGDPELLTLRGWACLQKCDVVLYDGLSNTDILRAAPDAEAICVGKHGQTRIWQQEEIVHEMLLHARAGKYVVRLKGGDPAVFARTSEEVDALRAESIPFEIVPGITAALAAGSFAGIPITHRGIASAVALVTGHEQPGKPDSDLNWHALAQFPGTLVIYMGVTTAKMWTEALIQNGKPPETPCAIIRRCSLPDQQRLQCRLDEVEGFLTPSSKMRPPVITIVGAVTELAESMNWFERRPLFGKTVLVTRPAEQSDTLQDALRDQGAHVLHQPAIAIGPVEDFTDLDEVIARISSFQTLIFCSRNGVRFFLDRLLAVHGDIRHLGQARLAVVGPATAEELCRYHLRADVVPDRFDAAGLASTLGTTVRDSKVLVVRASRGKNQWRQPLSAAGADVTEVVAYRHEAIQTPDPEIAQAMQSGRIDWVTLTSGEAAQAVYRWFGDSLLDVKLATLSPVTSDAVKSLGIRVAAEASPHTMAGIVAAICTAEQTS